MAKWAKTVSTGLANAKSSLYDLMMAFDTATQKAPHHVDAIQIQASPAGGAAKFWIGDADISPTNHGVELVATQAFTIQSLTGNMEFLKDYYLMCSADNMTWNIFAIVR